MRHSIACPRGARSARAVEVEPLAARDPDLPLHEIHAGHHLGDRMLDLQPGVHLEEVEAAVLVEEELDRARVGVAGRCRDGGCGFGELRAQTRASTTGDGVSSITF